MNILIVGGTSSIALGYLNLRIEELQRNKEQVSVTLIARDTAKLLAEEQHFSALGVQVNTVVMDFLNPPEQLFPIGPNYDEVVIAYGSLTDQSNGIKDRAYRQDQIKLNFVSVVDWLEATADHFESSAAGKLIVLGSVAGDRGRQSNYIYGACKGALEKYVQGLQHRLVSYSNINVLLVKPGFVDSPMTKHIPEKGFLWSTPEKIGASILKALNKNKQVHYAPFYWRYIMFIVRTIPTFIFERTKL